MIYQTIKKTVALPNHKVKIKTFETKMENIRIINRFFFFFLFRLTNERSMLIVALKKIRRGGQY